MYRRVVLSLTAALAVVALGAATSPSRAEIQDSVQRLERCKDMRAPVCLNAAAMLTNAGDRGVRATAPALKGMTRAGQILALSVLGGVESRRSTRSLVHITADRKLPSFVRSMAVTTVAPRGGRTVRQALLRALRDRDAVVRSTAARALGNSAHGGDKRVIRALIAATRDEDATVRVEALIGLGLAGDPRGGPALTDALGDREISVQRAAADGLRFVTCADAVPALVEALKTQDDELRRLANKALKRQTGRDFGEDYALWREWLDNR